jgi:SagB-type dehydrogenase family enzyme
VAAGDRRSAVARAAVSQTWIAASSAVVVIAAVYARITGKYGERGKRYAKIETGHAAQNLCLVATARGLGTTVVGAFDDAKLIEVLGLPADHRPLLLLPVGHPR